MYMYYSYTFSVLITTDHVSCPDASVDDGKVCTEAEPALWLLGDEGATGNGRIWARLLVPAPCKFFVCEHSEKN